MFQNTCWIASRILLVTNIKPKNNSTLLTSICKPATAFCTNCGACGHRVFKDRLMMRAWVIIERSLWCRSQNWWTNKNWANALLAIAAIYSSKSIITFSKDISELIKNFDGQLRILTCLDSISSVSFHPSSYHLQKLRQGFHHIMVLLMVVTQTEPMILYSD